MTTTRMALFALVAAALAAAGWWLGSKIVRGTSGRRVSGVPLGLFRIVFCTALLGDVLHLHALAPLIDDPMPFQALGDLDLRFLTAPWAAVVVLLVVGYRTRLAAWLNLAFTLATLPGLRDLEYHMDFVWILLAVMLPWAPVSARLSLDRLRATWRHSTLSRDHVPDGSVPETWPLVVVFLAVGCIYLDSVLYKGASTMWQRGLGVWLPGSIPHASWVDLSPLLDVRWLAVGLGSLTLVLETLFVFLLWWRPARVWLFLVGAGLHFGILVVFPIPWFALGMLALYLPLLPPGFCAWLGAKIRLDTPRLTFVYDGACALCLRTRLAIQHVDVRRTVRFVAVDESGDVAALAGIPREELLHDVHGVDERGRVVRGVALYRATALRVWPLQPLGWLLSVPGVTHVANAVYRRIAASRSCSTDGCSVAVAAPVPPPSSTPGRGMTAFLALFFACQVISSSLTPAARSMAEAAGFGARYRSWTSVAAPFTFHVSRAFLGITPHTMFLDEHFEEYRHAITLVYVAPDGVETPLPIYREDGLVHPAMTGRLWVYWTFRTVHTHPSPERFLPRAAGFARYWAEREGVAVEGARFAIRERPVRVTLSFEVGLMDRLNGEPWRDAGWIRLRDEGYEGRFALPR